MTDIAILKYSEEVNRISSNKIIKEFANLFIQRLNWKNLLKEEESENFIINLVAQSFLNHIDFMSHLQETSEEKIKWFFNDPIQKLKIVDHLSTAIIFNNENDDEIEFSVDFYGALEKLKNKENEYKNSSSVSNFKKCVKDYMEHIDKSFMTLNELKNTFKGYLEEIDETIKNGPVEFSDNIPEETHEDILGHISHVRGLEKAYHLYEELHTKYIENEKHNNSEKS